MWLINVNTYGLEAITNLDREHAYIILSHTWNPEGEVTFEDMKDLVKAKTKSGWAKISNTCSIAKSRHLRYAWIDTCCIDKSSSAELTEAINSMFQWYRLSELCVGYLQDLPPTPSPPTSPSQSREQLWEDLRLCRWFTRGWTLQELIAPENLDFYDGEWTNRGSKNNPSIRMLLSHITGIGEDVLDGQYPLSMVAAGKRMSWAAMRTTTRLEDMAYCLLGIFDVNMPLIYGEGSNAFIRLQEAIVQDSGDLSLFAWTAPRPKDLTAAFESISLQEYHGLFAHTPSQFISCRKLENIPDPHVFDVQSFSLRNKWVEFRNDMGLSLQTRITPRPNELDDYFMPLYCRDAQAVNPDRMIYIRLVKVVGGFTRHRADEQWEAVPLPVVSYRDGKGELEGHREDLAHQANSVLTISKVVRFVESTQLERQRLDNSFLLVVHLPRMTSYTFEAFGSCWDVGYGRCLTNGYDKFIGLSHIAFKSRDIRYGFPSGISLTLTCGLYREKRAGRILPGRGLLPWVAVHRPSAHSMVNITQQSGPEALLSPVEPTTHTYYTRLAALGRKLRETVWLGGDVPSHAAFMANSKTGQHMSRWTISSSVATVKPVLEKNWNPPVRLHEIHVTLAQEEADVGKIQPRPAV